MVHKSTKVIFKVTNNKPEPTDVPSFEELLFQIMTRLAQNTRQQNSKSTADIWACT